MKSTLVVLLFLLFASCQNSPSSPSEAAAEAEKVIQYDSVLAKTYGADDYGMKTYIMAFLKRGPNRDLPEAEDQELQMAHLKNIERMAGEGKLVLAGPFMDDQDIRGIYIFDVRTVEEAKALTETDPAIKAGSLAMELRPWYGSAALVALNNLHLRVQKKGITE